MSHLLEQCTISHFPSLCHPEWWWHSGWWLLHQPEWWASDALLLPWATCYIRLLRFGGTCSTPPTKMASPAYLSSVPLPFPSCSLCLSHSGLPPNLYRWQAHCSLVRLERIFTLKIWTPSGLDFFSSRDFYGRLNNTKFIFLSIGWCLCFRSNVWTWNNTSGSC